MNLSKSVKLALLATLACFLAHDVAAHFSANLNSLTALVNSTLLTPALDNSTTKLVKVILLIEISCLATPVVGPSIKILLELINSTTTAVFPVKGPKLMNTTLPTSTNFLKT